MAEKDENHKERDYEEYYRREDEGNSSLNRESMLGNKNSKKSYGTLVLFLLGVIAVAWFVTHQGDKKSKEGILQENEQFEPASKRPVTIPEVPSTTLPPSPVSKGLSEDDIAKAKEAEALRQTRLKSGIVIFQGGSASASKANVNSPEGEKEFSSNTVNGGNGIG